MKAILVLALALLLLLPLAVVGGRVSGSALAGGGCHRPREVLGSGASAATAGGVSLQATVGQPVVGASLLRKSRWGRASGMAARQSTISTCRR